MEVAGEHSNKEATQVPAIHPSGTGYCVFQKTWFWTSPDVRIEVIGILSAILTVFSSETGAGHVPAEDTHSWSGKDKGRE